MKTILLKSIITMFILFTIIGCSECDYIPKYQDLIEVPPPQRGSEQAARYKLSDKTTNYFDTNKNTIYLKIPLTSNNLYVDKVVDVSSTKINAIVVILDGNDGKCTKDLPISGYRQVQINIDELGLDKEKMSNHKKIKVFTLHDNKFDEDQLEKKFKDCVKSYSDYEDKKCKLGNYKCPSTQNVIPREQEGDIIPGQ